MYHSCDVIWGHDFCLTCSRNGLEITWNVMYNKRCNQLHTTLSSLHLLNIIQILGKNNNTVLLCYICILQCLAFLKLHFFSTDSLSLDVTEGAACCLWLSSYYYFAFMAISWSLVITGVSNNLPGNEQVGCLSVDLWKPEVIRCWHSAAYKSSAYKRSRVHVDDEVRWS